MRLAREPDMNITKLAAKLGIGKTSLFKYLGQDTDFANALDRAFKEGGDMDIELVKISLFRRAIGYSHASEKIFCTPTGSIRRVKTVAHYPPDTKAAVTYLERQDPDNWSEKKDTEPTDQPIKLDYDDKNL